MGIKRTLFLGLVCAMAPIAIGLLAGLYYLLISWLLGIGGKEIAQGAVACAIVSGVIFVCLCMKEGGR